MALLKAIANAARANGLTGLGQWIDGFGRPIPAQPDADRIRSQAIRDRLRDRENLDDVLKSLTPEKLVSYFEAASGGEIGLQVELAETIEERDAHVQSVVGTRILGALGVPFLVEAGDESDQAKLAAEEFRDAWNQLDHLGLCAVLLRAVYKQWAIAQVFWDLEGNRWRPVRFEEVDARRLAWPRTEQGTGNQWPGRGDQKAESDQQASVAIPGLIGENWLHTADADLIPLTPGSFVVHAHRATRGRPGLGAPVRAIAFWFMCKRLVVQDWAILLERFGMPVMVLKHRDGLAPAEVDAILRRIKLSAADLCIAMPIGSEIELSEALKAGPDVPHSKFITLCDEQISKAIIGSTTIADAAGNNESVSSPTHAAVRILIRNADATALATTLTNELCKPFGLWNHGPKVAPPRLVAQTEERLDPSRRVTVLRTAAEMTTVRMTSEQFYRELQIVKPDDVPEVIELKAGGQGAAAGFWGSGFGGQGSGAGEKINRDGQD